MSRQLITTINGVEIFAEVAESGEVFVPIKPICEAIGIDFKTQHEKISADLFLAPTMGIIPTVAADGKEREMVCLPLRYVYGWLATINPGKVAESARYGMDIFRRQCRDAISRHFFTYVQGVTAVSPQESELIQQINSAIERGKQAIRDRAKAEAALARLRDERRQAAEFKCLGNTLDSIAAGDLPF